MVGNFTNMTGCIYRSNCILDIIITGSIYLWPYIIYSSLAGTYVWCTWLAGIFFFLSISSPATLKIVMYNFNFCVDRN